MPPPRTVLVLAAVPVALALALLALVLPRAAAATPAHARWRWPVESRAVVGGFRYAPRHPFAAAQRRGVDLAAAPGAAVRSACTGRVTYAGRVPAGRGLGVTVRCGALVATHLGLARLAVRRGARVAAGTLVGTAGAAGRVRLGARREGERFGYVDPLALLRDDRPPHVPPLPLGRAPRGPRVPAPLVPAPRPRPVAGGASSSPPAGVPALAWGGLGLLAAGVPVGGVVHRSRRRRARATVPAAVS